MNQPAQQQNQMIIRRIQTECPYCKHKNVHPVNFINDAPQVRVIETCDVDSGGCDRDYAIYVQIAFKIDVIGILDKNQVQVKGEVDEASGN